MARYWRLWPLYLAVGATGLLVAYSYYKFGLMGAIALAAAALLFRQLAGHYVDRTLESVRWADEIVLVDSGSTDRTS